MKIIQWGLALVVGGFLIVFGVTKFAGGAHIFPYIEYKATGLGVPFSSLIFPLMNWATGALELLAGVLLILPMTRRIGSLLAVAPLLGAVVFHLSPLLGVSTPDGFADPKPKSALELGGPFTRGDFSEAMSASLFTIAAFMLAIAVVNVFIQRR